MRYSRQELKIMLKGQLLSIDYLLFTKLDGKKMSRVYDFYVGYETCFELMKEEPINEEEVKNLIRKVVVDFFMTIMDK